METIRISLKDLVQNTGQIPGVPANPRQWTKKEIDKIAKSLQETPELFEARPIIVIPWEGKYIILGGNLRYEGCKRNKDKDAPCFIIPDNTPVDKMKEIIIKDNGSFGEWDYDALGNLWDDLPLADWGVPAWDAQEVGGGQPDVQDDDFNPEDGVLVRCNPSDIWQLGDHRLMCGDSTDGGQVALLMDGEKANIAFTSPPYNAGHLDIPGNERTKKKYQNDEDQRDESEYTEFLRKNIEILLGVSSEVFYNLGVVAGNKMSIIKILYHFRNYFKDFIYWKKSNPVNAIAHGVISSSVELILCFGENNTRRFNDTHFQNGEYYLGVIEGSVASSNEYAKIHKATFPMYLPENIISNFSSPGAIVLDCFGGTGTTLVAAEQLNRRCYMMELDPHYCDVIIARWEKLTGKEARRINQ